MIQLTPPPSLTFAPLFNSRNHQTPFSAPFFLLQRPLEPATLRASQLSIAGAFLLSLGLSFYAVRHVASRIKLQVNGDDRNHKSQPIFDMFQTFSGSSRRPRQVNLSGQNTNPFAASSWTPSASGTQQTVANAQQERLQRQQERERLNASKRIQRTWRGHRVRHNLAESRRVLFDETDVADAGSARAGVGLVQKTRLLIAFFNRRRKDDINRLIDLSERISAFGYGPFLAHQDIERQVAPLSQVTLAALQGLLPGSSSSLLRLLVAIIEQYGQTFLSISRVYYGYLSSLLVANTSGTQDSDLLLTAIRTPLASQNYDIVLNAYAALSLEFLTTPYLENLLHGLDHLAAAINVEVISGVLVRELSSSSADHVLSDSRLWLLAHFIALHRLQQGNSQEPEFIRALSLQLSSSSSEVVGRIDIEDAESLQESGDSEDVKNLVSPPLPPFVKDQLASLVNQASITGLLAKFNMDYAKASAAGEEDASLLASYALTLLRIFPQRGDEIRMWLYLGSMTTQSGAQVPALKFFWQAVSLTYTFSTIKGDSKSALAILRSQMQPGPVTSGDIARDRDWRTILLFLELYAFVLRFTDDEEFLSGGTQVLEPRNGPISRIRQSALPLEDVKRLTIFLKNLAFTTYFNAGELSTDQQPIDAGLRTYLGAHTTPPRFQSRDTETITKRTAQRPFAGIAGMTFKYVRTIVTGVMRMLYQRDSRRPFLSKDHWLMTARFDMEGFIPDVVKEEERQHEVSEDGDDEDINDGQDITTSEGINLVGMAMPRRAQQIEIMRRQQQRAVRRKKLAEVGPRLEVLQNMPFSIPFETRVQIFRQFVFRDQTRRRGGNADPDIWRMSMQGHRAPGGEILGRHHAKIRRDQLFEDAFDQFYELGDGLKEPIQITFVDKFDTVEAGIDGGGVTKEFLTSVTNEAFRTGNGSSLFVTNDQNLLYPNPSSLDERKEFLKQAGLTESALEWKENIADLLRQYEFLGRIVGKCLYEGILVDIGFAGFFLLKWAASGGTGSDSGYRANINDLRDLDESLYQGLLKLKTYPGNVEDFSLDFTITDTISMPNAPTQTVTRELMPNGSSIPVTNENRPLYVSYVARHRLQIQPYHQTQAFLKGLGEIIKPSWLSMFNQSELQTLIGGDSSEIDVDDLRRNTAYGGVYQIGDDGLEHTTVQLFWKVMKELDDSDRRKVLKYVTSTPRAPLLGFSQLNPVFSIRDAGSDEDRLPSTSTCVNLLKLPRYSTAKILREKLLYAVNSGAGFDLS